MKGDPHEHPFTRKDNYLISIIMVKYIILSYDIKLLTFSISTKYFAENFTKKIQKLYNMYYINIVNVNMT
jgi:hypothetical protein